MLITLFLAHCRPHMALARYVSCNWSSASVTWTGASSGSRWPQPGTTVNDACGTSRDISRAHARGVIESSSPTTTATGTSVGNCCSTFRLSGLSNAAVQPRINPDDFTSLAMPSTVSHNPRSARLVAPRRSAGGESDACTPSTATAFINDLRLA